MEINILIDEDFETLIDMAWLQNIAEQTLTFQGVSPNTELGLVITGQEKVQELNRDYLGKDRPTDVIAFAMLPEAAGTPETDTLPFVVPPDGALHQGEVIISYPQAVIQAEEHHHPIKREIAILTIHGILHLLGYQDEKPELKCLMAAREADILSYIEQETNLPLV